MKLATLTTILAVFVAYAALTVAARKPGHASKPVPWEKIKNKDASHWMLFSEPRGTDLSKAKPKYHKCQVYPIRRRKIIDRLFKHNPHWEFQQLRHNLIAANCIECLEPVLGNIYLTELGNYFSCKFYENHPMK